MEQIVARLTPAALTAPAPNRQQLEQALLAAQAAPDHGRLRPWRFIVIQEGARARLGQVMAQALQQREPQTSAEQLTKEAEKPLRAPLIVVIACAVQPSAKIPESEQVMAVSAAAQNFQLSIHDQGYGCQWKTGPASRDALVKQALGLQSSDHIIGFMYVGSIAQPGRPRPDTLDMATVRAWA
jgi:nitroreductase